MQALEPRAGDELERLIERYGRVRLDPSPAQSRRARAAVMEEAWRRRLAPELAEAAARTAAAPGRRGLFASWGGRRLGGALVAASLAGLMIGSSAFAASRAGGPLYDTRLSLEALTLPSDPSTRLDAELARAQSRIAEIAEAASRGDDGAVNAAVRAYASTLIDLDAETGTSAGRARDAVAPPPGGAARPPPAGADAGAGRDRTRHLQQHGRDRPPRPGVASARRAGRRRRRRPERGRRQPRRRRRQPQRRRWWRDLQRRRQPERRWRRTPVAATVVAATRTPVAATAAAATRTPVAGVTAAGTAASLIGRPSPIPRRRPSTSRRPATDLGRRGGGDLRPRREPRTRRATRGYPRAMTAHA